MRIDGLADFKLTTADGVLKFLLKGGADGKAGIQLKAQNNAGKALANLPLGTTGALEGSTLATVQVLTSDAECFEAVVDDVKKATATSFKAGN